MKRTCVGIVSVFNMKSAFCKSCTKQVQCATECLQIAANISSNTGKREVYDRVKADYEIVVLLNDEIQ